MARRVRVYRVLFRVDRLTREDESTRRESPVTFVQAEYRIILYASNCSEEDKASGREVTLLTRSPSNCEVVESEWKGDFSCTKLQSRLLSCLRNLES